MYLSAFIAIRMKALLAVCKPLIVLGFHRSFNDTPTGQIRRAATALWIFCFIWQVLRLHHFERFYTLLCHIVWYTCGTGKTKAGSFFSSLLSSLPGAADPRRGSSWIFVPYRRSPAGAGLAVVDVDLHGDVRGGVAQEPLHLLLGDADLFPTRMPQNLHFIPMPHNKALQRGDGPVGRNPVGHQ